MTGEMGRRHNKDRANWPKYLTAVKRAGGRLYYFYQHPALGKRVGYGYDQQAAFDAANQMNKELGPGRDLIAKTLNPNQNTGSVPDFIEYFRDTILPKRRINGEPLSPETLKEYKRLCGIFIAQWQGKSFKTLSQGDIASFLNTSSTAEVYNKRRALLVQIWKHAVSDTIAAENLPEKIVKRDKERKKRQRLSIEDYQAIYKEATPAIQNAMELSLNIIQRRSDIQALKFTDNKDDGYLYIIQSKTKKHGKSAFLRIPASLPLVHSEQGCKTLANLIEHCRDNVLSPYVVHSKPIRKVKSKEKKHWTQLSRKQISDGFAEAREKAGLFKDCDPTERPTFHEVISLGEYLLKQAGWSLPQIQTARGHTTEKMTLHYLDGHDWTTVEPPVNPPKNRNN